MLIEILLALFVLHYADSDFMQLISLQIQPVLMKQLPIKASRSLSPVN